MSDTQLTPQQSFQQKIEDRLKSDIGDLIPDEALKEMVERAIESMFFKQREDNTDRYRKVIRPSWFEDTVEKRLHETMQARIDQYFLAHGEAIGKMTANAIVECIPAVLSSLILGGVNRAGSDIASNFQMNLGEFIRNNMPVN